MASRAIFQQWVRREYEEKGVVANLNRVDIEAAADAIIAWVAANTASYNVALPEPFKSIATPEQKTALLREVLNG